jgi:hypothetical protein
MTSAVIVTHTGMNACSTPTCLQFNKLFDVIAARRVAFERFRKAPAGAFAITMLQPAIGKGSAAASRSFYEFECVLLNRS